MIDPAFGNWFAGFVAGEGSFLVQRTGTHDQTWKYRCFFNLTQRADDKAILDEIQVTLGFGKVQGPYARHASPGERTTQRKPQVMFNTQSKADCSALRDVLQAFPLRAKKRHDFEIWCEALDLWLEHKPGDPWESMGLIKAELEAVRKYG